MVVPDFLFLFLSLSFSVSFLLSTFLRLFLSEEVSGYSYCWCWLLINRVPSYQPTRDWLFSTKQGGGGAGWCGGVALGNHETCVNLNRDLGKSSRRLCVCVQVCGCVPAMELFSWSLWGQSSGDTDPPDNPEYPTDTCWMPAEYPHPARTPAGIKVALCQTPPPHKDMSCQSKGIEMISSFNWKHCISHRD